MPKRDLVLAALGRNVRRQRDALSRSGGWQTAANFRRKPSPSGVPQHRERIFPVGFKERRAFEFPEFPTDGPKLESILETNVPGKDTLTDQLWN